MKPERQLLLDQAAACRQLALIADARIARQLKEMATEYETLALVDTDLLGDEPNASTDANVRSDQTVQGA